MNRILKAQPLAVFAALALAACAVPEASADTAAETPRTITVNGQGEASAAPDMAILSIGVQSEGATAAEALRQNSADMSSAIATLKDLGVEDRDLQTSGLSINPRYDYQSNRNVRRLIGYTASNTLTVKLRDLDNAGGVIDAAVQSGANSIGGISFTFSNPKPLMDTARRNAVADARAKAELLTEAAGVNLGQVITIQGGHTSSPSPRPMMMRMEAAADSSVPIEAGESSISANVTIVYEIR